MWPATARRLAAALCWGALLAARGAAAAGGFALRASEVSEQLSRERAAQRLFAELTALLGHGASHERLGRLQDALRPTFAALPKNDKGTLEPGVARYALHRYFLARRGWRVKGLRPEGQRWNESDATSMFEGRVPSYIFELMEERMGAGGFGLPELSVLAATVEDVVHSDAVQLLHEIYERLGLSTSSPLDSEGMVDLVMRSFLLLFLVPKHRKSDRALELLVSDRMDTKLYAGWKETVLWARDVQETVKLQDRTMHSPFASRKDHFLDYPSMVHLVERIMDGMGDIQDLECMQMKDKLMDQEDTERNDGRVRLARFYKNYVESGEKDYHFSESPAFLREVGALDEESGLGPSVIVPNLMYSHPNCLGISGMISFCCVDHCIRLREALETRIKHPAAEPGLIAQIVAELPSQTVPAPRNLSASLQQKLDMIAAHHGGLVPLHGRLFDQFLHHAYPNECARPAPSGEEATFGFATDWSTWYTADRRVQPDALRAIEGQAAAELQAAMMAGSGLGDEAEDEVRLPWAEGEQLVAEHRAPPPAEDQQGQWPRRGLLRHALRFVALVLTAGGTVAALGGDVGSAVLRRGSKALAADLLPLRRSQAPAAGSAAVSWI